MRDTKIKDTEETSNRIIKDKLDELKFFEATIPPQIPKIYVSIQNDNLREYFILSHAIILDSYQRMNLALDKPQRYFTAPLSNRLRRSIDLLFDLHGALKNTKLSFNIDSYYEDLLYDSQNYVGGGGTNLPSNLKKAKLPHSQPIFSLSNKIKITHTSTNTSEMDLSEIGKGSYATVYKFHDPFLNRDLALKKANGDLNSEEIERFAIEFQTLDDLDSPYIVEVYNVDKESTHYTLEYFPHRLSDYYNQQDVGMEIRLSIAKQVCSAVDYIISKKVYHRDLSPNNVLIKEYDDGSVVAKLSDFGLVKIPDSTKTKYQTNPKGSYIPAEIALRRVSYDKYGKLQEISSLTNLLFFIMNGFDFEDIYDDNNVYIDAYKAGTNEILEQRINNVPELLKLFLDAASRVNR